MGSKKAGSSNQQKMGATKERRELRKGGALLENRQPRKRQQVVRDLSNWCGEWKEGENRQTKRGERGDLKEKGRTRER